MVEYRLVNGIRECVKKNRRQVAEILFREGVNQE